MGSHIVDGEFQSDKYPTCPRGKVPLSVKDPTAQDLLWEYAQRRRAVDAEFSADLETSLIAAGYLVVVCAWCGKGHAAICQASHQGTRCAAHVWQREGEWVLTGSYGSRVADMTTYKFAKNLPSLPSDPVCDTCIQKYIDDGTLVELEEMHSP